MSSKRMLVGALVLGATAAVSGIAQAQTRWDTQPGCLSQVTVGYDYLFGIGCGSGNQAIFYESTSQVPNDSWTRMTGLGIQVSAGTDDWPWVINSAGSDYVWDPYTGAWLQEPGRIRSIAVGNTGNNQVWGISCTLVSNGNYDIYSWNGSGWTQMPGAAAKISVAPGTTNPYVVTAQGLVYEWSGSAWVKQTWIPCATQFYPPQGEASQLGTLTACGSNDVYSYQLAADGSSYNWFETGGAATSISFSMTGTGSSTSANGLWATSPGGNICYGSSFTEGNGWCISNF